MIVRVTFLVLFGVTLFFFSCEKGDTYDKIVKNELASGIRNDSLFLGYSLGMPDEEFYSHSWQLNKKQLVREGPQNQTVQYELNDILPHPAVMNFYPDFKDKKIYRMRTSFSYKGWAPWNKNLSSDSLFFDVKKLMEDWYGKGFFEMNKPDLGECFVKIDGNREILIFKADDIIVNVYFTDLSAIKEEINTE